jgi:vacuolar-type H+-ATPase subunit E/Vma4
VTFGAASGGQAERHERTRLSSSPARDRRGAGRVAVAVLVSCIAAVSAPAALADNHRATKPPRSDLKPLWSAFPLRQKQRHQGANTGQQPPQRPATTNGAESGGSGWSVLRLMLAFGTGLLFVAALAVVGVSLLRRRRSRPRRAPVPELAQPLFHLAEGGPNVAFLRRRPERDREANASPEQSQEEAAAARTPRDRLLQYSMTDHSPANEGPTEAPAAKGPAQAPAEPAIETEVEAVQSNPPIDVTSVGEEVGTVLKSAHEAAARIRRAAQEEADRVRREAETAAADTVAEASRLSHEDRAEGARIREEAEEYAKETRSEADAFAEQRRSDAEQDAAQIVGNAQRRLADADAEVEQKMREATARERRRIEALQAEVARYEERLDSILTVFQGVTSQLEDLLGKRTAEHGGRLDAPHELGEALRPHRSGSNVG